MTSDEKPQIRKVWLPTEMKAALNEYCWKNRTKPSPFIVSIIEGFLAEPTKYGGELVPPAGKDYSSVYIRDSVWFSAAEAASQMNVQLSAIVRVGIARALAEEGIPWDVSTPRPQNRRIPKQE